MLPIMTHRFARAIVLGTVLIFCVLLPLASRAAPNEIEFTDQIIGNGPEPRRGWFAIIRYTGWIYDASKPESKGTKFDSTDDHDPITFRLGNGEVIPGWDRGLEGMRVGGKRRLVIPPDLGYGAEGTPGGPIPPNAGLVFDIELADVK